MERLLSHARIVTRGQLVNGLTQQAASPNFRKTRERMWDKLRRLVVENRRGRPSVLARHG